ncbi:Ig-like domain-containing protein [Phycisphaera mikurensis]|uniref:Cadherin domain-containing protein n=1 Tax=Phycisphaera mikurensis (strain NBRC 102666 / KCTC 22515 / FYK2301M01) TaxID=1142394 RepID=I0IGU0_PHYMF|nr:hypothetical protein [Phycisphaera mikurensis]MBB6440735.1 hypothetical protein [Phycisphaera mikurensis]BAM04478.1 hypothetical protein PSMK_23190 [Phycisphaera mikurensis NBRC 102666]
MPQRSATRSTRPHATVPLAAAGVLLCGSTLAAATATADTARRFVHTTEADFAPGEAEGFSVTAYGELVPVPAFEALPDAPEGVETLLALAADGGGTVYAAGGTASGGAAVVKLVADAWEEVAAFGDAQVFCLLAAGDELLAGVSAADGASRVVALGGGEPRTVLELPEDRYVWAMAGTPGRTPLLLATGIEGRVLSVAFEAVAGEGADGAGERPEPVVVLDAAQANVLALAASPGGFPFFAGTDTDGIVYRIDAAEGDDPLAAVAVFDAAEPEVAALAVHGDGRVYVGTADAEQAKPGRLGDPAGESTGKPQIADDAVGDSNDADLPPIEPGPVELAEGATPAAPGAVAPTAAPDAAAAGGSGDEPAAEEGAPATEEAGEPGAATPTPADYDALRETLKEKLASAKQTGTLELEGVAAASSTPKASRPRTPDQPAAEKKEGNAVYELLPEGSSREVFRETSMVLALALDDAGQRLLIGTGGEGELHAVDVADGTRTLVRDLDSQQVTALLAGGDGVTVAASSPALAGRLPGGRPTGEAVYTSASLDAGRTALFGRIRLDATGPGGTAFGVETRSGATADPEAAPWSAWIPAGELAAGDPAASLEIPASPARFLQYRLTLAARPDADAAAATPAVESVTLSYAVPNLAPRVTRLTLEAAEPEEPGAEADPTVSIAWEANDPDEDTLSYDVSWRLEGSDAWLLAAEDLTETTFDWDTRGLGSGRYTVRVAATDAPDNPPGQERTSTRRSDVFLLDNTPPTLEASAEEESGELVITGTASDATGTVAGVAFRVGDDAAFRPVAAADLLFDSAEEAFRLPLPGLDRSRGHVVTLRAADARGNAAFRSVVVPAKP